MLLGFSFGVLARPVMGPVAAIVMSVVVFAGSAQFAALAVLSAGGGAAAAIVAGILLNLRFVPMGIAIAPSLRHGGLGRAFRGQALVDASWALANRGDGRFDIEFLLGSTLAQYPGWVLGTVLGALAGGAIGNPGALGLDAIFPAFFLALLAAELRHLPVAEDEVGGFGLKKVDGGRTVVGFQDGIATRGKNFCKGFAEVGLVVDDENFGGHRV